jgi:glutamine phosphoribosylpyrophosphate amidotransferase
MCSVIGIRSNDVRDLPIVRKLLEESQIRGKHSTGVSYISKYGLTTLKDKIPSREFTDKYWFHIEEEIQKYGSINLIAHTRYSTSGDPDIKNAQPIADGELSISMNGVITQANLNQWKTLFNVECKTTNDTEIAHIKMSNGVNPLTLSKNQDDIHFSMAICQLWVDGNIQFYRNGRRPLYYAELEGYSKFTIVASTKEIIKRSLVGFEDSTKLLNITKTEPGTVYGLQANKVVILDKIEGINLQDWQL